MTAPVQPDPVARFREGLNQLAGTPERSVLSRLRDFAVNGVIGLFKGLASFEQQRRFGHSDIGISPEEQQAAAGLGAAVMSASLAPTLTATLLATGTTLRTITRDESVGSAAVTTLEEAFALAGPVADAADQLGADDLAALIRKHPIIAEFVLQAGHDFGVLGASRGLSKAATNRLVVDFQLDEAITESVKAINALTPFEASPALSNAIERVVVNRPLQRTALADQLGALLEQRVAAQRAIETNAPNIELIGRGGRARVPEPGLVDVEAALRQEPHALGVTGRQALGMDADVSLVGATARSLAGREAAVVDQLAVNMVRETDALAGIIAEGQLLPLSIRNDFYDMVLGGSEQQLVARQRAQAAIAARELGEVGTRQMLGEAERLATRALPPTRGAMHAEPLWRRELQATRAKMTSEQGGSPVIGLGKSDLRIRDATPSEARALGNRVLGGDGLPAVKADDGTLYTRREPAEHGDLVPHAEEQFDAAFTNPRVSGWIVDGRYVSVKEIQDVIAPLQQSGPATRALDLGLLQSELGGASARLVSQLAFLGGGAALARSENEYVRYTGLGLMVLGGGSFVAPLVARAGRAGLRAGLSTIERTISEDAALAVGRWFVPEYGWGKEFLEIRAQIKRNAAFADAISQDMAKEARQLADEAAALVRVQARQLGASRPEARALAAQQRGITLRALSDVAELEGPGAAALVDPVASARFFLTPELESRALAFADRLLSRFHDVGRREVELGRFAQATLDKRAGHYLPRFYLDLERRLFLGDASAPLPQVRRPTGMRATKVGVRDDGIPYRVRVDELKEIREIDYRALRGLSKAWHNVAVETAFDQVRKLGKVWDVHDEAALYVKKLQRLATALELNDAPAADLLAARRRLQAARGEVRRLDAQPPPGFRKLADTDGLGSLRGRWVDAETHRFLNDFDKVSTPKKAAVSWNGLMQAWKYAMTAMNLPTHVGNIGSNTMLAFMGGGLPWWRADVYAGAMADYLVGRGVRTGVAPMLAVPGARRWFQGGALYRELREQGVIGKTFIAQETRDALTEFSDIATHDARAFLREAADAEGGNLAQGVQTALARTDKFIRAFGTVYQAEEEMFKVALYAYRRSLGDAPEAAAKLANDVLIDYSARSGFINFGKTLMPFFTFPAKAGPMLARAFVAHPERLPIAAAPFIAMDLISRHLAGAPAVQPYSTQKLGALDVRYTQVPIITEDGDMVFMNTGRFTPWGNFITGSPVETILPSWWPQALVPSNPIIGAASLFFARDPFNGDPIIHDLQTAPEKAMVLARETGKLAMPSMLSRSLPRALRALDRQALDEAAIEAAGVVGLRPVRVPQTGERERVGAFLRLREAGELAKRELRRELRETGDTVEVRRRAREYGIRWLQLLQEEASKLPQRQQ